MKNLHLATTSDGKPALYCERGLICVFEAGYQPTREQDAKDILAALARLELVEKASAELLIYLEEQDRAGKRVHPFASRVMPLRDALGK